MKSKYWLALALMSVTVTGGLSARADDAAPAPAVPAPSGPLGSDGNPMAPTAGSGNAPLPFSEVLFPNGLFGAALQNRLGKGGTVDYAQFKGDKNLQAYIEDVARADRSKFPVVSLGKPDKNKPELLDHSFENAYLINAYNAFVIKTLADAYPLDSPDQVKGFDTEKRFVVGGATLSLQELRAQIVERDPRAFFALITGTKSGPVLATDPYTYSTMDSMLDAAVKAYINDPRRVMVTRIENKVTVDQYLQQANDLFAPRNAHGDLPDRKNWAGVKRLLQVYTTRGGDKRYFNAGDYKLVWSPIDHQLNYENLTSGATSAPNTTMGDINSN